MKREIDYDAIGNQFERFTDTAAQRFVEVRTIMHMVGEVQNQNVLDLACGYGFFGRALLRQGASQVLGVDISPKMIQLAREASIHNNDAIAYQVANAAYVEVYGEFDLVVAAWLFNYAQTPDELTNMFKTVACNLKPSGRLVAYTVHPDYALEKGNFTAYGVTVLSDEPWHGGSRCKAEFVTATPSPFTFYRWTRQQYESAIRAAGFSSFRWQEPMLESSDRDRHTAGFWQVFEDNCLQTGLVCKP